METLVKTWELTVIASMFALTAFLAPLLAKYESVGQSLLLVTFTIACCATAMIVALAIWRHRSIKAGRQHPELPAAHLFSAGSAQNQATAEPKTLDAAIGGAHMRELRAQVDLLCTMATAERMGPELVDALKHSSVPTLALQAAVSAQVVRNILAGPALASELRRSQIRMDGLGVETLKEDLLAISTALTILADRVRDEHAPLAPVWTEIANREKFAAGLTPVDDLLVQSTLLLSAVSDMARILATIYGRTETRWTNWTGEMEDSAEHPFDDPEFAAGWQDVPAWKLN